MNKKLIKLVKQDHVQQLLAFGMSRNKKPYYTLKDSLANPDPAVVAEIPEVFGYTWQEVKDAVIAHCDIDKEFHPTPLF